MNRPDQDTLLRAVEDARRILGEYIEPGSRGIGRKAASVGGLFRWYVKTELRFER